MKLCSLIDPHLQKDRAMAKVRTKIDQPITTQIMLHCLIRWLAGGSHHDIRLHVGISKSAFCRCVHGVIRAIKKVEELRIKFPKTEDGWKKVADGFANISSASIIDGCVGCVDGILLHIETPTKKEAGNVRSFHSGHCRKFGINCQCVADAECRFLFASLAAPGGANDIVAF